MSETSDIPKEIIDERPFRSWEKQSKKSLVRRLTTFSGIGSVISAISLVGVGIFLFVNFWGDAPMPPGYVAPPVSLSSILFIGSIVSVAIGFPLGIFQWISLKGNLKKTRLVWWIFLYCAGLIPSIFIGWVIEEYVHNATIPAIVIAWLIASSLIGLMQWFILRKWILNGVLLIPMNILAILLFASCLGGGIILFKTFIGILIGCFPGGSIYGALLAYLIVRSLKKEVILSA